MSTPTRFNAFLKELPKGTPRLHALLRFQAAQLNLARTLKVRAQEAADACAWASEELERARAEEPNA